MKRVFNSRWRYEDIAQVSIAEYNYIAGNKRQFSLKTPDDQLYYFLQLDEENRIGAFDVNTNSYVTRFNKEIYLLNLEKQQLKSVDAEMVMCCRRQASWSKCMNCTGEACGKRWVCIVSLVVAGPETPAAFAVSCMGAGPNTWC